MALEAVVGDGEGDLEAGEGVAFSRTWDPLTR